MRPQVHVTAIVATHDGADFLARTLAALRNQSRPIERFVGVDADSSDASADVLRANLPSNALLVQARKHSLGHSVAQAVAALPPARSDRDEWLWIIHDDSMPAPDALEHLTAAVEASETVTIAGCKLLDIDSPRRLIDVGLGTDRKAQRLTLVDVDEVDQGQYDGRSDYFAVSSAGMFIRRDVFEQLDGFDPALPGRGDDIDLCWRNRLAGHRVVVVPAAKIYHHIEVVDRLAGPREARRSEVFLRLKYASAPALPFVALGILLAGLGHFFISLLAKDPGHAFSYLGATLRGVFNPVKLAASRKQVKQIRQVPRHQVTRMMVDRAHVREYQRNLADKAEESQVFGDGSGVEAAAEPSGDNFSDFVRIAGPPKTTAVFSLILALLVSAGASLYTWRSILGAQALTGGALKPFSLSLAEISANAFSWWQPAAGGLSAAPDNTDMLYLLFSLVTFDHANQAAAAVMIAAMPLAALFAWLGARTLTSSRALRFFIALFWALQPALISALGSGRVGAVLIHLVLPLFFTAIFKAMKAGLKDQLLQDKAGTNVGAWTASACAALLLFVISTGSIPFFLTLVVLLYLLAVLRPQRSRTLWWIPLPAVIWNLPLLLAAISQPRLLFTEPGAPQAFTAGAPWQQALGFPEAFDALGTPLGFGFLPDGPWALVLALVIGVPLLAIALAGTIGSGFSSNSTMRGNSRIMILAALLSLLASWAVSFVPVALAADRTVSPYTGPFVSFAAFALLAAAANSIALLRREQLAAAARPTAPKALLGTLATLGSIGLVGALALTVLGQGAGANPDEQLTAMTPGQLVQSTTERSVPATAADAGRGELQERTLVLRSSPDGSIDTQLLSAAGESLDSLSRASQAGQLAGTLLNPERNQASAIENLQRESVAMLLAESTVDARANLRELGVGYVVLDETGESVSATVRTLDAATGLAAIGQTDRGWLWRVDYADTAEAGAGFARLVAKDGSVQVLPSERGMMDEVQVPAAAESRTLVLATAHDARLSATIDGKTLRSVPYPLDGEQRWAQGFDIPEQGGALTLKHTQPLALPLLVLGLLVLLITALLAIPVPGTRRLSSYRNTEYRYRDTENAPLTAATSTGTAGTPQPGPTEEQPTAVPAQPAGSSTPLNRREARERQQKLREQLAPKASDRLSDSSGDQEKK